MRTPERNPEAFLKVASQRGRLRVFLGFAAGVGKTYAMLQQAHQRLTEGLDVLVGYVEPHRRPETEALLEGLPQWPTLEVTHRGLPLRQLDLKGLLERRPALVLIDELAYSNPPGARHPKRYQDVEELLQAGIDVYTTVNIQHLESLNDIVETITGIKVRETIPDRVVQQAEEISLLDLPPGELLQRLKDGKIYSAEQARRAAERFFRPGNLTALRELSLRTTASRVEDQMLEYMQARNIAGPWPASERLLVCVGPSPLSQRLVRAGLRLAQALNADWFALTVEAPGRPLGAEANERLQQHLALAESLGASSVFLQGSDFSQTVIDYARSQNITKIIIGKPLRPLWQEFLRGSPVSRLIALSGSIDVYVVSSQSETSPKTRRDRLRRNPLRGLPRALAGVAWATLLGSLLAPHLSATDVAMLYLAAQVGIAYRLGRSAAVWSSLLSILAFDFFFVEPYWTLNVRDSSFLFTFVVLLLVGLVISSLTASAREQALEASVRENQTAALFELSRQLARVSDEAQGIALAETSLAQRFGTSFVLVAQGGHLLPPEQTPLSSNELAVAEWCFVNQREAGKASESLSGSLWHWRPILATDQRTLGVLGVENPPQTPADRVFLQAHSTLVSLTLERQLRAREAQRTQELEASEKLQRALLNSISHDLRIPLVSITGALSTVREMDLDVETQGLVDEALNQSGRLNRLVENLLQMSRIESGHLQIRALPCDLQDLIGSTLDCCASLLEGRSVRTPIAADLPLISCDYVLMQQVLINLIDNAIKFSPPGSPLEIGASFDAGQAQLWVADRGRGIPEGHSSRVLQRFYRHDSLGSGLGLAICEGIVEAHQGQLTLEPRSGGGTQVRVKLPQHG